MTLSEADAIKIRDRLSEVIGEVARVVDDSPAQGLFCLNVDWFKAMS